MPGGPGSPVRYGDLLFSCSAVSNSLRPHGLQHTRPPCPSPTPGACSNSGPSSQWCHPTISSFVVLSFSCLQSFLASGSFPMTLVLSADTLIASFPEHTCSATWSRSKAFPISAPVGLDGRTAHSVPAHPWATSQEFGTFFSREKLLCYPCKALYQKCQWESLSCISWCWKI